MGAGGASSACAGKVTARPMRIAAKPERAPVTSAPLSPQIAETCRKAGRCQALGLADDIRKLRCGSLSLRSGGGRTLRMAARRQGNIDRSGCDFLDLAALGHGFVTGTKTDSTDHALENSEDEKSAPIHLEHPRFNFFELENFDSKYQICTLQPNADPSNLVLDPIF